MYIRVYARVRVLLYICTAWASVLLFFTKGNTRASISGTARLQSRFRFLENKVEHCLTGSRFRFLQGLWRNFNH